MLQTQPWALFFPRKRACTVPILAILGTIWAFWRFRALDGHGLALTASGRLLRGCISWSSSLASWDYRVSALGTHLRASRCRTRYSGIWGGRPASRLKSPGSGAFGPGIMHAPGTARGTCQIFFFGRATGQKWPQTGRARTGSARRVGRSKSFVAPTYWSAFTALSAYAPTLSSNLARRDVRLAILQPGTER